MKRYLIWLPVIIAVAGVGHMPRLAAAPYSPVPVFGPPLTGPEVQPPTDVYGKEYSHDFDRSVFGAADPEQIVNWDGAGGTMEGIDYSFTRPGWDFDQEIDAIANHRDALFRELLRDDAHLVWSHDDEISVYPMGPGGPVAPMVLPGGGPITLASGVKVGGAGELNVELAGAYHPPSTHALWAKQPEIDGMFPTKDVDGVEVWGLEPPPGEDQEMVFIGDANKYSLDIDGPSGVSVWNASGTPYISHAMIVGAVETLLGALPPSAILPGGNGGIEGPEAINLDALMVFDTAGSIDRFDDERLPPESEEPIDQVRQSIKDNEPMDTVVFSIRQILDDVDPDGYYATGSELFVLDGDGSVSFLKHGGHVWDDAYALSELAIKLDENEDFYGVLDINAIEAIGQEQEIPLGPCPGDFNGDGTVNLADYTVYRDNLGSTDESLIAFNGQIDGVIDSDDYGVWKSHFGSTCPLVALSTSSSAVPEPTTGVLALASVCGLLGATHYRRRMNQ